MIPHVEKAMEVALSSGASIASLVVFLLVVISVIVLVVRPTRLKLPERLQCCGLSSLLLSYAWMPVLGSLLMLACRCLTIEQLWHGIKGNEDIKPYAIVILFMSLAYMSYSLDSTGGLSWVALHITARSRGNGRALFIFYFVLSGVMTTVTSNDIVIMTFTPIILHFAKATGTEPLPFLVAMFSSANLWSMTLIIGNPTNIIAGDAFNMTFLEYSKWMALPTLGGYAS
jgi:arsenical pump membrane protein